MANPAGAINNNQRPAAHIAWNSQPLRRHLRTGIHTFVEVSTPTTQTIVKGGVNLVIGTTCLIANAGLKTIAPECAQPIDACTLNTGLAVKAALEPKIDHCVEATCNGTETAMQTVAEKCVNVAEYCF